MTSALPVDEGRRQAYLAALGIPLWSARVELPGALPSALLAFVPFVAAAVVPAAAASPVADDLPVAPATAAAGPGVAAPEVPPGGVLRAGMPPVAPATGGAAGAAAMVAPGARGAAAPALAEAAPGVRAPTAEGTPGARPPAAGAAQDERFPRINCRAWTLAPGLCAVIALDDAPDLAAAEYRLLDNIARALDATDMPAPQGNLLRWPLNRNPALDHGTEAMRTWLAHALRLPPGRCVVFGEALAAHVAAALPGTVVIAAPSLAGLLADAGAKRRLWQALHG